MAIDVRNQPDQSRYAIFSDDAPAGFAAYEQGDGEILLTHTEIDPSFGGKGLGSGLARGVLDDARAQNLAVLPRCEFISGYIKRHEEYLDLVPADRRSEFGL